MDDIRSVTIHDPDLYSFHTQIRIPLVSDLSVLMLRHTHSWSTRPHLLSPRVPHEALCDVSRENPCFLYQGSTTFTKSVSVSLTEVDSLETSLKEKTSSRGSTTREDPVEHRLMTTHTHTFRVGGTWLNLLRPLSKFGVFGVFSRLRTTLDGVSS